MIVITQPCHASGHNLVDGGSCVCASLCCNSENGDCTCPDCNGVSCNCTPESRKREEVAEEGGRSCDLQVGDRVKGSGSGQLGTVTHVAYNGNSQQQVWARKDNAAPFRGDWTQPLPRNRFILAERAATPMKFKAGDKVRYKTNQLRPGNREVTYVSDRWVLYAYQGGEEAVRRGAFERNYELVPDFFEAGKTYRRHDSYSTFEVEHIQRDGDGQLVAIGRKTNKYAAGSGTTYWHMQRSFGDGDGWEEV